MRLPSKLGKVVSLMLSVALALSVCLPWYRLPIMGWDVPAPPWNVAGLTLFVLSGLLFLRGVAGAWFRWAVRAAWLPSVYLWWQSLESTRTWGIKTLAPLQLKLSGLNVALGQLGAPEVEIFRVQAWKSLAPAFGWHLAGGCLTATLIFTLIDAAHMGKCGGCGARVSPEDSFCHACGQAQRDGPRCSRCARAVKKEDAFCRDCGQPVSDSGEVRSGEV